MKRAIIALSPEGASIGSRLAAAWRGADLFIHEKAALDGVALGATKPRSTRERPPLPAFAVRQAHGPEQRRRVSLTSALSHAGERAVPPASSKEVRFPSRTGFKWHSFASVLDLTARIFTKYRGLVYVMPCGVVVRAIAPHARHKKSDPAIVVVDVGARFAVSLLSGHEGGANELAQEAANALGAEPVISTTTEARKRFIVGVGCRRGVSARAVCTAIRHALKEAGVPLSEVRTLASADIKSDERGLLSAARSLHLPLRFIRSEELKECQREFTRSEFVKQKVGLPAVAEPCALLAGTRTRLRLPKRIHGPVTVSVAEEDCWWWESAPADRSIAPAVPSRPSRRPRSS